LYLSSHSTENWATTVWAYPCGSRVRFIEHLLRAIWVSVGKWNNTCPTVIDIDHNPLFVALKIETYDVAYSHQNGDWFSGSLYDTAEEVVFEV
jgi:hypothetical protein